MDDSLHDVDWVKQRIDQRNQQRADAGLISRSFDEIWEGLWREIVAAANTYRNECGTYSVITNGTPQRRIVGIPDPMQVLHGEVFEYKRKLTIDSSADKKTINAGSIRFQLKTGDGNVVRLAYDGREYTLEEAARLILDPLLFPEFAGS